MKISLMHYFFVALSLIAATHCGAQTKVNLRTLALQSGEMPEWYVEAVQEKSAGKTELTELAWSSKQPSASITVTVEEQLFIYSKAVDERGNEAPRLVRRVTLPEGASEVLLVALIADDSRIGLRAVTDTFMEAGFNDWMVINLARQGVALRFGKDSKPIIVNPGGIEKYTIPAESGTGIQLLAKAQLHGELKTIYSTYWPVFGGQRSIVIFFNLGDRIRARRVIDPFRGEKDNQT
jgi:hypothetical protein